MQASRISVSASPSLLGCLSLSQLLKKLGELFAFLGVHCDLCFKTSILNI